MQNSRKHDYWSKLISVLSVKCNILTHYYLVIKLSFQGITSLKQSALQKLCSEILCNYLQAEILQKKKWIPCFYEISLMLPPPKAHTKLNTHTTKRDRQNLIKNVSKT